MVLLHVLVTASMDPRFQIFPPWLLEMCIVYSRCATLTLEYHFVTFYSGLKLSTLKLPNRLHITDRGINNIQGLNPILLLSDNRL